MDPNFEGKDIEPKIEIACNPDYRFTSFIWGALDKSIYACTTNGRVIQYDVTTGKEIQ